MNYYALQNAIACPPPPPRRNGAPHVYHDGYLAGSCGSSMVASDDYDLRQEVYNLRSNMAFMMTSLQLCQMQIQMQMQMHVQMPHQMNAGVIEQINDTFRQQQDMLNNEKEKNEQLMNVQRIWHSSASDDCDYTHLTETEN